MARARLVLVGIATVLASGAGCRTSRSPPSEPAPIEIAIAASDRLNPDENGRSLPTLVHIYQLKTAAKLERTEYERLYRAPAEALGADLLQTEELVISPGERLSRRLERERSARVLAVVALFRRPNGDSWRALVDLPSPTSPTRVNFHIEGYRIDRR